METLTTIWNLFCSYGPSIIIIAVCAIVLLGILKACKVFDKISSSNAKKAIYFGIDLVIAFVGSAIYFGAYGVAWSAYPLYAISALVAILALYAFYENVGLRWCVRKLLSLFSAWLTKHQDSKLAKTLASVGLTSESVAKIVELVDSMLEEEKATAAETTETAEVTEEVKTETAEAPTTTVIKK